MATFETYVHWLQTQQTAPEIVHAHREAIALIAPHAGSGPLLPRHLEAALREQERAGAPARRLVNLQIVGEAVLRWQREQRATEAATAPLARETPLRAPRGTPAPALAAPPRTARPACECRSPQPLYLEEPPTWLRSLGALTGLGSLGLLAALGVWGSTTVTLVLGAMGFLAAALVTQWRCTGCRQAIGKAALDVEQARAANKRRMICLAATLGLLATAAMAGQRWREEIAMDRELVEAQQRLNEMFGD